MRLALALLALAALLAGATAGLAQAPEPPAGSLLFPGEERFLANMRQLTHGGENAEAYFSWDGGRLIFQSTRDGRACDQIYLMQPDGSDVRRVSTGTGRTTCGFFFPDGKRILYASTHLAGPDCPPPPDRSKGYVWALYDYDVFVARDDGRKLRRLTDHPGYDAEAATTPDGKTIVFTSLREGDLDIYSMDAKGRRLKRLTTEYGFDGGPFVSWDGKEIVYRGFHPQTDEERADYADLIGRQLMRPKRAEIYLMNLDGTNQRQLTANGAANWAPAFHPNGRQIIFSSNLAEPGSRNFDLYLMSRDGSGLERVTFGGWQAFAYFSPDGRQLVFCSDRFAAPHEYNVFLADWLGE